MLKKLANISIFVFVIILAGGLMAQGTDPGTDALIHLWTFDDGTADDAIGGANGTVVGDVLIGEGQALFWELDQYIELPGDIMALAAYEGLTIETWFTPQEASNLEHHMVWYFGDTDGDFGNNYLFYSPARMDEMSRVAISCGVTVEPWTGEDGVSTPEVDDGLLHHVVCTIDYSFISHYLDGEFVGETTVGTTSADNFIANISPNLAYIGKGGYTNDPTWLGSVDELKIFSKALNADEITFLYNNKGTPVADNATSASKKISLSQNYPNPFNPVTNISFELAGNSQVNITVYDLLGNEVATLVNGVKSSGIHTVAFDGSNLSSGMYVYKMSIDGQTVQTKRMMLMK